MNRLAAALVATFCATMALFHLALAQTGPDGRRSGYDDMTPSVQKMQDDDMSNPGMLWVQEGATLWAKKTGTNNLACADCHQGADAAALKGVAARYPAWSPPAGRVVTLENRIQLCREWHQKGEALAFESRELLALSAFVASQSRGLPMSVPDDRRLDAALKQGESLFQQRQGQLNLSCAHCHDANAGQKLAAVTIPQAHPTGYPIYRLEWQTMGSLKRRLRNCLIGVRAEPWAYDAPEYTALELHLTRRAQGMKIETPAVRP